MTNTMIDALVGIRCVEQAAYRLGKSHREGRIPSSPLLPKYSDTFIRLNCHFSVW